VQREGKRKPKKAKKNKLAGSHETKAEAGENNGFLEILLLPGLERVYF